MKILCFSDVHLHTDEELFKIVSTIKKEKDNLDSIIFCGDIVSLLKYKNDKELKMEADIFLKFLKEMENLDVPFYFIYGNRDRVMLHILKVKFNDVWNEICNVVNSSNNLKLLETLNRYSLNCSKLYITSDLKLVDKNTIFIRHSPKFKEYGSVQVVDYWEIQDLKSKVFLILEGHIHIGHVWDNYINLGFLHRDNFHGARSMYGYYWILEIDENKLNFKVTPKFIENNFKIYKCPIHSGYGDWILPKFYPKCPLCYWEEKLGKRIF